MALKLHYVPLISPEQLTYKLTEKLLDMSDNEGPKNKNFNTYKTLQQISEKLLKFLNPTPSKSKKLLAVKIKTLTHSRNLEGITWNKKSKILKKEKKKSEKKTRKNVKFTTILKLNFYY